MSRTKTVSLKLAMKLLSDPKSRCTCSLSQSLFPDTVCANANASKAKSAAILITKFSSSQVPTNE